MNSSFLYHAWGLYSLECTREEYKGNTIILHVQSKKRQKECPKCGKCYLIKNGYRTSIIRKTKRFAIPKRAVYFLKTKRTTREYSPTQIYFRPDYTGIHKM